MVPHCSSRCSRSATAGGERPTRLPSSARESRASRCNSVIRRQFVSSSGPFEAIAPRIPLTAHVREGIRVRTCWPVSDRVPPHLYSVVSAVFHYLGPAFAVLLFARVDVLGVAWLRIASAALVFALWRRPWRKFVALDHNGQLLIVALGAVFAFMNACFYISIDRLPLATVAAIEFIGPIALALIAARTSRNLAAVLAAALGVYLLTHVRFGGQELGVAFAFANAALFTAYIVVAHRVSRRSAMGGVDGLAAA